MPVLGGGASDIALAAGTLGLGGQDWEDLAPLFKNVGEISYGLRVGLARRAVLDTERSERIAFWKRYYPEEMIPSFVARPEIPMEYFAGSSPLTLQGKGLRIGSEQDLWRVIWSDVRLKEIKSALQAGKLNELDVLKRAVSEIRSSF